MKFGEKLKEQRKKHKLTQEELAKELGIVRRSLVNYEQGTSYPKERGIYKKLADFFDVDINYFLTEDEEFLTSVAKHYGKRGLDQASVILDQTAALFAGGELSEADQIAFEQDMKRLFLDSKEKAREKFTPKKHRKMSED